MIESSFLVSIRSPIPLTDRQIIVDPITTIIKHEIMIKGEFSLIMEIVGRLIIKAAEIAIVIIGKVISFIFVEKLSFLEWSRLLTRSGIISPLILGKLDVVGI